MKFVSTAIAFGSLLLSVWQTQVGQAPPLQPTPLEAFAKMPATHIAWSNEVGRLDTSEAHAVVTALVLEDAAQPPDRMRGIRIDLRNRDSEDQVYLGEETLGVYKNALDEITRFVKLSAEDVAPGGCEYFGAEVFWYGHKVPSVHALTAAQYFIRDSSGLSVNAFKHTEFRFPHQDASQLSAAIATAIDQLKNSK